MKREELKYIKDQMELQQISEIKIYYKSKIKSEQLSNSKDVSNILFQWWDESINIIESFVILLFNRVNRIIGIYKVSQGGITGTVIDKRLICSVSLLSGSSNIILCHNHPSGNLKPSENDIKITATLSESLKLLDINLIDHIILSPENKQYFSFADEGLIYNN